MFAWRKLVGAMLVAALVLPLLAARSARIAPATRRASVSECANMAGGCAPLAPVARDCCRRGAPAPALPRLVGARPEHAATLAALHAAVDRSTRPPAPAALTRLPLLVSALLGPCPPSLSVLRI